MENIQGEVINTGDISVEIIREAETKISNSLILEKLKLKPKNYYLFTLHRSENTNIKCLKYIIEIFNKIPESKIVFPIHPRTANILDQSNLFKELKKCKNVIVTDPFGYLDFIKLIKYSNKVITDSG